MSRLRELDVDSVGAFLHACYGHVRRDVELGPVFEAGVSDWDVFIATMTRFWCEVLLEGRVELAEVPAFLRFGFTRSNLARWLKLWSATAEAVFAPVEAERVRAAAYAVVPSAAGLAV